MVTLSSESISLPEVGQPIMTCLDFSSMWKMSLLKVSSSFMFSQNK